MSPSSAYGTLAVYLALAGTAISQSLPAWWTAGNSPVVISGAPGNNSGPANVGQAKWMAMKALEALRAVHPATANLVEADLVGPGKPISAWNVPVTEVEKDNQKGSLVIGQLKAISKPFYDHLNAYDAAWLTAQRSLNGIPATGTYYPWTNATGDDDNKAAATIGQLKAVFSLRFETLSSGTDSDGDGMPDAWEISYGLNPNDPNDATFDPDNDALTSLEEYRLGTVPTGIYRFIGTPLLSTVTESGNSVNAPEEFFAVGPEGSAITRQVGVNSVYYHRLKEGLGVLSRSGPHPLAGTAATTAVRVDEEGKLNGEEAGASSAVSFLKPDLSGAGTAVSWTDIALNLSSYGVPHAGGGSVHIAPVAVSPSGGKRLHRDDIGNLYVLDASGGYVGEGPPSSHDTFTDIEWKTINDEGDALAVSSLVDPVSMQRETAFLWWNGYSVSAIPAPTEWWNGGGAPVVRFLSDDRRAIIDREVQNQGGGAGVRSEILDPVYQTFESIPAPSGVSPVVAAIPRTGDRLLMNGSTLWQIFPDGTPVDLAKMRIASQFNDTPVAFSQTIPNPVSPRGITSEGLITLTGENALNELSLFQLVPNNDSDNDGVPDDWERWWANQLIESGNDFTPAQLVELNSGNLNPDADYTSEGVSVLNQYRLTRTSGSLSNYLAGTQMIIQHRELFQHSTNIHDPEDYNYPGGGLTYLTHTEIPWQASSVMLDQFQPASAFTPSALAGRLDSEMPWRNNLFTDAYTTGLMSIRAAATKDTPIQHASATEYLATAIQTRVKVRNPWSSGRDRYVSFIHVKRNNPSERQGASLGWYMGQAANGTEEASVIHALIKRGTTTSEWAELKPAFLQGKYSEEMLAPIEFLDYHGGSHLKAAEVPKCCGQKAAMDMLVHRYPGWGSDGSVYMGAGDSLDLTVLVSDLPSYLKYHMIYEFMGEESHRQELEDGYERQVVSFNPATGAPELARIALGAHGFEMKAVLAVSIGETEIYRSPGYEFLVDDAHRRNAEFKLKIAPFGPGSKSKGSVSEVLMGLMLHSVSKEIVFMVEKNIRDHTTHPDYYLKDPRATQGTNRLIIRTLGEQMGTPNSEWDQAATAALALEQGAGIKVWMMPDIIFNKAFPMFEAIENKVRGQGWAEYGCPCGGDADVLKAASLRGVSKKEVLDELSKSFPAAGTVNGLVLEELVDGVKGYIMKMKLPDLSNNFDASWNLGGCCN